MKEAAEKSQSEIASEWGIAILVFIMRFTGPGFVKVLVIPVAFYYFLASPVSRSVSRAYLERLREFAAGHPVSGKFLKWPGNWFVYRHILSFSQSMVDRVYSWNSGSASMEYEISDEQVLDAALAEDAPGCVILVSHLGNFDLAIARRDVNTTKKFNIVMDTSGTRTYNSFRNRLFESEQVRFIEPDSMDPVQTIDLVSRTAAGEAVVIAADRIMDASHKNSASVEFLGHSAVFPTGPYLLAHLLEAPVYLLFAMQKGKKCIVRFELFAENISIPRKHRADTMKRYAQQYAETLQQECVAYPLQWYNFYDFWNEAPE